MELIRVFDEWLNESNNEFPANVDTFHNKLSAWFLSSVLNIGNNNLINNKPLIESAYGYLKSVLSSGASESIVGQAWNRYFSSFLIGGWFVPTNPPPGYIPPIVSPSIILPSPMFSYNMGSFSTESIKTDAKIRHLVLSYKRWIMSQKSFESWSIPGPNGPTPAPPKTFNIKITE